MLLMGKIVSIAALRQEKSVTLEIAWQRFVDAKLLSEKTLDLQDGIAAGKAYRDFCELVARAS
jgi:hypothetical protein